MSTNPSPDTQAENTRAAEEKALHRKFAIDCFNGTWNLLDQADRTPQEDQRMIHMAHASRFHWGEIGTPLEFARGDWQLSRVYAVLGRAEAAMLYALSSLNHCLENNIGDFDLAFAYEALARACALLGDHERFAHYLDQATQAAEQIAAEGDRTYFLNELKTIQPR